MKMPDEVPTRLRSGTLCTELGDVDTTVENGTLKAFLLRLKSLISPTQRIKLVL